MSPPAIRHQSESHLNCRCAKLPPVQTRLVEASLYVDLMSISGTKRLIAKGSRRRLYSKASQKRWG